MEEETKSRDNNETVLLLREGIRSLLQAMEMLKAEIASQENTINLHDITLTQLGITVGEKNVAIKEYCKIVEDQNLVISLQNKTVEQLDIAIKNINANVQSLRVENEKQRCEIEIMRANVSNVLCRDNFWSLLESVKKTVNDLRTTNRYTIIEALQQKFKTTIPQMSE